MDAEIQWMFLFGPRVMPLSGKAKRDWGQKSLQTSFGIPLAPQTHYKMKAVVIGDSSISSVGVKYGLSMVLRNAGVYFDWLLAKAGACARDLADIWDNAHHVILASSSRIATTFFRNSLCLHTFPKTSKLWWRARTEKHSHTQFSL